MLEAICGPDLQKEGHSITDLAYLGALGDPPALDEVGMMLLAVRCMDSVVRNGRLNTNSRINSSRKEGKEASEKVSSVDQPLILPTSVILYWAHKEKKKKKVFAVGSTKYYHVSGR